MKRIIYLLLVCLTGIIQTKAQPIDLILNTSERGTKYHQATNSIVFYPGYSYSNGGTMTAKITNEIITAYNLPVDPAARILNTGYQVGTTAGSIGVNGYGGANYSIPLTVLPGVNGLAPSLALVYSSNAGPGVAGFGWSLTGLSAISRVPQNFYNDGATRGIQLDASDRFALDGQRLVTTSGNYGSTGTIYQTEIESFTRVVSESSLGSGPEKFYTLTKSGIKNFYGTTDNGRQTLDGITEPIVWYLTKTEDLFGNQINYTYLKDHNTVYLSSINYGSSLISFYYKQRVDPKTYYLKGKKIEQQLLLDKITMAYYGNSIRTYELKYNFLSNDYIGHSVLNEVIELGLNNSRYNSTVFSYQQPANVVITGMINAPAQADLNYQSYLYSGDFNGDGKGDVICLPNASEGAIWTGWKIYLNNGSNGFYYSTGGQDEYKYIRTSDLNGDGNDDLIMSRLVSPQGSQITNERFEAWISNGTSFSATIFAEKTPDTYHTGNYLRYRSDASDFNGDGLSDFFFYDLNGSFEIYAFQYLNGALSNFSLIASGTIDLSGKIIFADFNGDNKTDIWRTHSTGTIIYNLQGQNLQSIYSDTYPNWTHQFDFGDYNGDGQTDIFVYGYGGGDYTNWIIGLSTGVGFDIHSFPQKKINLKNHLIRQADFNDDGCTDLMVSTSGGNCSYLISDNSGTNFLTVDSYVNLEHLWNYLLNDFNGDGRTDILYTPNDTGWTGYRVARSDGYSDPLLNKVANGFNHLTNINYLKLSQAEPSEYNKGSEQTLFPVYKYQGAMNVVKSIEAQNGLGGLQTIYYCYEGAKIHRQGKGFLGFAKTITKNLETGRYSETQTVLETVYYTPSSILTFQKYNSTTMATNTLNFSNQILDAANKRIFNYMASSSQTNELTGHSVSSSISGYDQYGNPGTITKTYSNGTSEIISATYENNTNEWKLGKLLTSTLTLTRLNEANVTHSKRFTYYDPDFIRPDFVYSHESTGSAVTQNHDYDSHGNLVQVFTEAANLGVSQVNYTYTPDGTRLLTSTDALRHTTTNTYDTYGRLETITDYLGNVQTYHPDYMGRVQTVSNTFGSSAGTSLIFDNGSGIANVLFKSTTTGNDGSMEMSWHDLLGRPLRSARRSLGGQIILSDTEYDSEGRVYRVSEPRFESNPTIKWAETYTYDNFGRTTDITRLTGPSTHYGYNGATVTETTGSKTFSKTMAADGLLAEATDPGGNLTYSYYADGKPKNITAPGNVITTMQYADAARNQTQLTDPSAGSINYTYNGAGLVWTQTNARGQTTTYNYLSDGRLDYFASQAEGTTDYTYFSNGLISQISSPGQVQRSYTYDAKGRPKSTTETVDGISQMVEYEYDEKGRLFKKKYNETDYEQYGYDQNSGYLYSIQFNGTTVWQLTEMDAFNRVTKATLGNVATINSFDGNHLLSRLQADGVQDMAYTFDATTGNLLNRSNQTKSLTETFGYDTQNLDRLSSVTGPSAQTVAYTSNHNGNIQSKSDAGTFSYGASPYALSGISNAQNISPVPQQVNYTSFEKINDITQGTKSAWFTYNADQQRVKMVLKDNGQTTKTHYYFGSNIEHEVVDGQTTQYLWIGGDAYSAVAVAKKEGSGSWTVYNIFRDHLGTIAHLKNATTGVVNNYSFDAWGRRRDADNWTYTLTEEASLFADRGFTGHEYLAEFDLYNMNGRLYDPIVGRFLSPDPLIQSPDYTQSYNRYSYALNNPLKYSDPSGYNVQPTTYQDEIPWVYRPSRGGGSSFQPTTNFMPPGRGGNGTGLNGYYYDWFSDSYRSTTGDNNVVGWDDVYSSVSKFADVTYNFKNEVVAVRTGAFYRDNKGRPIEIDGTMGYGMTDWIERIRIEVTSTGGDGQTNWGVYITGAVLTGEDLYNNFFHNHTTYFLKNGKERTILNAQGKIRINSSLARNAANVSTTVKALGAAGSALMTGVAVYNIRSGNGKALDYGDATVGALGTVSGAAQLLGLGSIPVVGEGVALYSWGRLWFDIGSKYGPSTWYGNDNTKWFK